MELGISQECMSSNQPQWSRYLSAMQRPVMRHASPRIIEHLPATVRSTTAEVDIFVIKEKPFVETAEIAETVAVYNQASAGSPVNGIAFHMRLMLALSSFARSQEPCQCPQERREPADRSLG